MTLANPLLLWSLLGLAVPVAIHMLSRKEGQVIRLGSIRHLQETSTQQFKGIRLNELFLLALRCGLIFIFCLLLSELRCSGVSNKKWVVIEAGSENSALAKTVVDSLTSEGYEQHFLCEGFPINIHDRVPPLDYWMLIEQLREKNLSTAVVISSNRFENYKGRRISLPSNITWIEVPTHQIDFSIEAIRLASDSIFVRSGHSTSDQTYFTTENTKNAPESVSVSLPDFVQISIVTDDIFKYDRRILIASLNAIKKTFPVKLVLREYSSSQYSLKNTDWCIWLSKARPPKIDSLSEIVMNPNASNNLIEQTSPRVWSFTKRLDEEVALDKNLTLLLAGLIVPSRKQVEIVNANDIRTMPDSLAWSANKELASASAVTTDADRLLIICLVALLLTERFFAYRRKQ